MKLAYKVVACYPHGYWSLTTSILGQYSVRYCLGEIARPVIDGSKLFVYTSLKHAYRAHSAVLGDLYKVLLCEVGGLDIVEQSEYITPPEYASAGWKDGKLIYYDNIFDIKQPLIYLPGAGRIGLVDWVKPLEVVSL